MVYSKKEKNARLNYLSGKKHSLTAQLEKKPKNAHLQNELYNVNNEINKLEYQINDMEGRTYGQPYEDYDLEL